MKHVFAVADSIRTGSTRITAPKPARLYLAGFVYLCGGWLVLAGAGETSKVFLDRPLMGW
jgi:hypothetical protein